MRIGMRIICTFCNPDTVAMLTYLPREPRPVSGWCSYNSDYLPLPAVTRSGLGWVWSDTDNRGGREQLWAPRYCDPSCVPLSGLCTRCSLYWMHMLNAEYLCFVLLLTHPSQIFSDVFGGKLLYPSSNIINHTTVSKHTFYFGKYVNTICPLTNSKMPLLCW